jgi:hypothetical protein
MLLRRPVCFALFATLLLNGCKDRQITSYRAAKDPAPAALPPAPAGNLPADHPPIGPGQATGPDMASTAVPTGSDSLVWTAPAHWTAKPLGAMRKGSFAVKGPDGTEADLSITAFPGNTGGLSANLNRWRGQIGLPPLTEGQTGPALEHLDGDGLHFEVADFAGTANGAPTRILGAVLSRPGETWFFKLMGPDALVAAQKDSFRVFLRTVKEQAR